MRVFLRKYCVLIIVFLIQYAAVNAIPSGYYYFSQNKKKADLKTSLRINCSPFYELQYGGGTGFTWEGFYKTDNSNDTVIDMYSDSIRKFNGFSAVSGMHIEHSFPKSWWGAYENGAYKDLFHLYPADGVTNSTKNDLPLGEVSGTPTFYNGVTKIGKNGFGTTYAGNCFEPADEYKGDFARSYFYISTIYETLYPLWQSPMLNNNLWPVWKPWAIDLLLKWNKQDPVSKKEIDRQEAVYKIQGNRNPFIDYPELAEYIWGKDTTQIYPFPKEEGAFFVSPRRGTNIDFGVILQSDIHVQKLHLTGVNLNSAYPVKIEKKNPSFVLSDESIATQNILNGTDIEITFSPTTAGEYHDTLSITGGGVADTLKIPVKALASADFITLEPTDISPVGGLLQWISDPQASDYQLTLFDSVQQAGDLIISAYVEGSSWNKALELFNGTNRTIDLSNYSLQKQSNGAGNFTNTLKLNGTLAPFSSYVIVHKQAGAALMSKQNLITDSLLQFNGNDAIRLVRSGVTIDMVGKPNAGADVVWGLDTGLQRKNSVTHATSNFDVTEWNILPVDSFTFLGLHQMDFASSGPIILFQTLTGKVTSYSIQNLSPNSIATYKVEAIRTDGNRTAINTMQIHTSGLKAPEISEPTDISSFGFTARWEISAFATGYLLRLFQLTGAADTTVTEGFAGVGSTGKPLPNGWSGTASGNYETTTSAGISIPSVGLKNNGEWIQTITYPHPVTQLTFMYRFPSAATGSSFLLEALSDSKWTRIDSVAYKSTTAKTYPVYNFSKSMNYTGFKFIFKKVNGNLSIDDVQAKYGNQDTLFINTGSDYVANFYEFKSASAGTNYFYQVAAKRDGAMSPWSDVMSLKTPGFTGVNTPSICFPKVFISNKKIHFERLNRGDLIQIYTITGSCIYSAKAVSEDENLNFNQKGIFIVRISSDRSNFAFKIVE